MDEVSSHVCLVLPSTDGKAAPKIVPPRLRIPYWKGLGADSEEKHEPASDIDTVVADSLKVLDPKRPIREADITVDLGSRRSDGQRLAVWTKPYNQQLSTKPAAAVAQDSGGQVLRPAPLVYCAGRCP